MSCMLSDNLWNLVFNNEPVSTKRGCAENCQAAFVMSTERRLSGLEAIYHTKSDIPEDNVTEVLPVVTTQPLQIILETSGSWDVNAVSPVSSTSSHGTTAKRFGYRPGEDFFCTILVHPEHFEIRLNDMPFASSEHLVPVSSIHAIQVDGDATISTICFGHPMAIEKHNRDPHESSVAQNLTYQDKGVPSIIECRMAMDKELQAAYMRDSTKDLRKMGAEFSRSAFELFTPDEEKPKEENYISELPGLKRATSYQLVFDVDDSDLDETDQPNLLKNDRRTKSQFNLNHMKKYSLSEDKTEGPQGKVNQSYKPRRSLKRNPQGVARKVNARRDEAQRTVATPSGNESVPPSVVRRPSFNSQLSDKLYHRPPVSTSNMSSSSVRKLLSRSQQNIPLVTEETQVGTEVRLRPAYRPLLPYEDEQLEQLTDEESQISVPSYRPLFRGRKQTKPYPYPTVPQDQQRSQTLDLHVDRQMDHVNGFDPRRATYAGVQNPINPVIIRSPLTLLDQQWDQVLPVIPNPPDLLGRTDEHSHVSPENTISSNSEENYPPYLHWYTQMKQSSKRVSMIICDDPGPICSDHEQTQPMPPNYSNNPTKELDSEEFQKPTFPLSPVISNGSIHSTQMNVTLAKTKQMDRADKLESHDADKSANFNGDYVLHTSTIASNGHSKYENENNPEEPILLIDCIPMDADICVVQQPIEAWPAKSNPPEIAQVVQPWVNRMSLQLESHTFSHPVEGVIPPKETEDDTESLMSTMTKRSDYGILSSAFDDPVEVPGHSVHDPRTLDCPAVERQVNPQPDSKETEVQHVLSPPQNCIVQKHQKELDSRETVSVPRDPYDSYESHGPSPAPIIFKRSTTTVTRPPQHSVNDLNRVQPQKDLVPEISEIMNFKMTKGAEKSTEREIPEKVAMSTDKLSGVPKLFRGLQSRRSFLNGKWTPKPNRKSDGTEKYSTADVKSTAAKGQPIDPNANGVNSNGNDNVNRTTSNDGIKPVSYTHLDVYKRQLLL
ncbi:hypothetical protein FGIG_03762 [Fasciola gigantica]|uniref:Galectin domain-containing protein n=1 Tax=Fasciola gigantica TaxID=46835 RepID=A0A504Z7N7_FASGI|nr:hypothetical protein FGIG_03762 [Fasciola gigantica]